MITVLELGGVSVDVIFKDIKNVHLSVHPPTGRVRISAPDRMDIENIRLFAISKLGWIKKHQRKLLVQEREQPRRYIERESHYLWGDRYLLSIVEAHKAGVKIGHRKIELYVPEGSSLEKRREVLDRWYRTELKAAVLPLIAKWEKRLDLHVDRFFVQRMKTKWGSSNPKLRTIRLNLELAKKSPQCLDYVTLHEMLHFLVPHHGERFLSLLERHMPNWGPFGACRMDALSCLSLLSKGLKNSRLVGIAENRCLNYRIICGEYLAPAENNIYNLRKGCGDRLCQLTSMNWPAGRNSAGIRTPLPSHLQPCATAKGG